MADRQTDKKDRDIEDLLNKDGRMMRSPLLWFMLLLIPIVASFYGALRHETIPAGTAITSVVEYSPPGQPVQIVARDTRHRGSPAGPGCDLKEWIGKAADEKMLTAARAMNRPFRIIPPRAIIKQNYSPDRINFETDADGKIIHVWCG